MSFRLNDKHFLHRGAGIEQRVAAQIEAHDGSDRQANGDGNDGNQHACLAPFLGAGWGCNGRLHGRAFAGGDAGAACSLA